MLVIALKSTIFINKIVPTGESSGDQRRPETENVSTEIMHSYLKCTQIQADK